MSIQREDKKFPVKLLVILLLIVFMTGAILTGLFAGSDITNVKKGGCISVVEGMSVQHAANEMFEADIIHFPLVFRVISRIKGYDTQIQKGLVEITPGMSYIEILELLINPERNVIKVTIPEGFEIHEIAERVSEIVDEEEFFEALEKDYDYKFLENIPDREQKLEGYLFPATYELEYGMTGEEVVNKMLSSFDEHFSDEYYARAAELGMSVDDIVTLASIIERESASGAERAKVAGVFHNRLKTNMRLQSCATVQYILKERKAVLSKEDTMIDSPYNTYRNDGLPLGPIASPGEECIKAALYPEDTDALYFVLGSDGKHIFSESYEEHLEAKNGGR